MNGFEHVMINLPNKFEVAVSTHYEDMKDDTKCRNLGGLWYLGATQSYRTWHHLIDGINKFLLLPSVL